MGRQDARHKKNGDPRHKTKENRETRRESTENGEMRYETKNQWGDKKLDKKRVDETQDKKNWERICKTKKNGERIRYHNLL